MRAVHTPARCARSHRVRSLVEESDWDMQIVPNEVAKLLAEIISRCRRNETIVPADDALADRLFEAGLALAERFGAYCVSTNRRIQFSRGEILAALDVAPDRGDPGPGQRPAHRAQAPGGRHGLPHHQGRRRGDARHRGALSAGDAILRPGTAGRCDHQRHAAKRLRPRDPQPFTVGGARGWHEVELSKAAPPGRTARTRHRLCRGLGLGDSARSPPLPMAALARPTGTTSP